MSGELLPCPFCGSNKLRTFSGVGFRRYAMVKCMDCGARGGCYAKIDNCHSAWNRRYTIEGVALHHTTAKGCDKETATV